jgi:hypothetical protein
MVIEEAKPILIINIIVKNSIGSLTVLSPISKKNKIAISELVIIAKIILIINLLKKTLPGDNVSLNNNIVPLSSSETNDLPCDIIAEKNITIQIKPEIICSDNFSFAIAKETTVRQTSTNIKSELRAYRCLNSL